MNLARKADPYSLKEMQPRHHRHDIALVQYYGFSQRCENTQNRKKEGQKNRSLLRKQIPQESFNVSWGICFYSVYHWIITIFLLTR